MRIMDIRANIAPATFVIALHRARGRSHPLFKLSGLPSTIFAIFCAWRQSA